MRLVLQKLFSLVTWLTDLLALGQGNLQKAIFKLHVKEIIESDREMSQAGFGWKEFKQQRSWYHYILSLVLLVIILGVVKLLLFIPGMQLSILLAFADGIGWIAQHFIKLDISRYVFVAGFLFLILNFKKVPTVIGNLGEVVKNLPSYALAEEILFRKGSERWTFIQRVRSCISFGLLHLTMIIVPIGVALTLSLGGMMFMVVYLYAFRRTQSDRKATIASATLHTAYNQTVFALGQIYITIIAILALVGIFWPVANHLLKVITFS